MPDASTNGSLAPGERVRVRASNQTNCIVPVGGEDRIRARDYND